LPKGFYFLVYILFNSFQVIAQDAQRFDGVPENLGKQINSPYDELNPVFTPDGTTLYFTRSRHPENNGGRDDLGDIWKSTKDDAGNWTEAVNAGKKLNNGYYNAVAGFSPNGKIIYLHNHYFKKGIRPATQGLSFAKKSGDGWDAPSKLESENFYNQSQHQSASVSAVGKDMVLA